MRKKRQLLKTEYLLGGSVFVTGLILLAFKAYLETPDVIRFSLIALALVIILTVSFIAVGIEQRAGRKKCCNRGRIFSLLAFVEVFAIIV